MRTIRSKPAGNSIYRVSGFGRIVSLFVGHCLWGERADKGCGCVDRKASFLSASITCAHTLAQSFAWIVRGLLSEWYGGRLVLKCGETLEWHGVQIQWVTHYLCVQEIRWLDGCKCGDFLPPLSLKGFEKTNRYKGHGKNSGFICQESVRFLSGLEVNAQTFPGMSLLVMEIFGQDTRPMSRTGSSSCCWSRLEPMPTVSVSVTE